MLLVPQLEGGKAEIQTLAPKPTLMPPTHPRGARSGEGPLSHVHRDPANTLGPQQHTAGADTSTTHLLPDVLSPPCENP